MNRKFTMTPLTGIISTYIKMIRLKQLFSCIVLLMPLIVFAQPIIADKVVGVVGKSHILYSEVEEQYLQMKAQGQSVDRCGIFEELLAQKLLVTQAGIDSIEVTESEIEMELEQRLGYFINQIGTEEKLVAYFGKSVLEIKEDMRDAVREQNLTRKMQAEIIKDLSITPADVKKFYNNLSPDSIPTIDSEIEIAQIVVYPKIDKETVFELREKMLNLRERVINGESFSTLAVLYSEGPSARSGGDIGWSARSSLDPAYAKAAFALKKGQVSKIVESSFGYHLIQLIDKTDDRIHTKHILMKPKIKVEAGINAKLRLDSIAQKIRLDSLTFENAAMYYSYDKETRMNGGLKVNPTTLNTKFKVDEFSTTEYYVIRNLSLGEISEPFESTDAKGKKVYKIVQLKSRTEPHKANLKDDFDLLKKAALQDKQTQILEEWIKEKSKDSYVRLEAPYKDCKFRTPSWKK